MIVDGVIVVVVDDVIVVVVVVMLSCLSLWLSLSSSSRQ
jgi:hypothetical protein